MGALAAASGCASGGGTTSSVASSGAPASAIGACGPAAGATVLSEHATNSAIGSASARENESGATARIIAASMTRPRPPARVWVRASGRASRRASAQGLGADRSLNA